MEEVIWIWTVEPMRSGEPLDLTGWDVVARDGDIGKIDEATYDTAAGLLVVDTGHWILGKRRLLPAGVVNNLDPDNHRVFVSCTKSEVRSAPDYDAELRAEEEYRQEVARAFSASDANPES
jgi:hypothetical protein